MKNKNKEDYKGILIYFLDGLLLGLNTFAFACVWYGFYRKLIFAPFWHRGNWGLIAIYALIDFLFARFYGGLKVGYHKWQDVFYSLSLATVCANVVAYIQISLIHRWFMPFMPIVVMSLVQILIDLIWSLSSLFVYSRIYRARRLLLIYGARDPGDLIQKMASRSDKYQIRDVVNVDRGEEFIRAKIADYDGVVLWDLDAGLRNRYLKYCFDHSIRCYLSPKISDIILDGSERIHLFDTPLLVAKNTGLSIEQRFFKRLTDIVFSSAAILIGLIPMLLIALLVKLYDGGPVFYTQDRLTIGGKPFTIYKFRSMRTDSEAEGARLASRNDSRITPIGKVLRNLHLDELPQLFNVFKGDMSLVGPRPERLSIMEKYEKSIPEFHYRLKVKAGLTGYAQVYGKYNTTPYDKLKLDLYYIENYSLVLDFKLMLMTVKIFCQKDASEGVEDTQETALRESGGEKES